MKRLKHRLTLLLPMLMFMAGLQAQQSISAGGGDAESNEGSVSYSIGQLVYSTNAGENGSVAEGVQQPYEISVIVAIPETNGIGLSCKAYPNPTTDLLTLMVADYPLDNLSYYLFSLNGNLLDTEKILEKETSISMLNYQSGTYILKILDKDKEAKTFAIIKH